MTTNKAKLDEYNELVAEMYKLREARDEIHNKLEDIDKKMNTLIDEMYEQETTIMTTKIELTPKQSHELHQKIWDLRNKMVNKLNELEVIHEKSFPTVGDASDALYTVYNTWNSEEYENLEEVIKEIRGE